MKTMYDLVHADKFREIDNFILVNKYETISYLPTKYVRGIKRLEILIRLSDKKE